jgi:glutamine synthetase
MIHIPLTVSFYKKRSRIHNSYILEYIWIDRHGNLHSKYRTATINFMDSGNDYIAVENWNYDDNDNHEVTLVPVAHYANPFFDPGRAFLVLCDTPAETNFRRDAIKVFETCNYNSGGCKLDPWFRIKQSVTGTGTQSGTHTITLRKLTEKHYEHCLIAGLKIGGINAEVAPNRWEFRIGPCPGIRTGDELWVARFILHKLGEEFGVCIRFKSDLAADTADTADTLITTFSTETTRNRNGLKCIYNYIDRLWKKHAHHAAGFALGAAATASIRVPKSVLNAGCGHLEDRRPASDADPYRVIAAIFSGACFD